MDSQKGQKKPSLKKRKYTQKNIFLLTKKYNTSSRFLVFEAFQIQQAKAYTKKPRTGKAARPFVNRNPPTTTKGTKRSRPDGEMEDEPPARAPTPLNSGTGNLKTIFFLSLYFLLYPLLPLKHDRNSSLISLAFKKSRVADPEFFRNIHSGSESRFKYLV